MAVSYNAVYGSDMLEVPSIPTVSSSMSTNIGGSNVRFTIEHPEDIVYNGKNSYLTAQLQIVQVRLDGTKTTLEPIVNSGGYIDPAVISIPHLCSNPLGAIFDTVKCVISSTDVNNFQSAGTTSTLYRMIFESKLEQSTVNSTSAIKVMSQE